MSAAHAPVLAAIHRLAFERPWSEASFAELLFHAHRGGWLAIAGGEPVGFLLFQSLAGDAEILTVAVRPEFRRRGTGAALIDRFVASAGEVGFASLFLEVSEANAGARKLYEQAGFVLAGRRRGYYLADGGAEDALLYRRDLRP